MSDFHKHIAHLFKLEEAESHFPLDTPFTGVFLPQHQLIIHCIPLHHTETLPHNFCVDLSNKAEQLNLKIIHLWEDVYIKNKTLVEARLLSLIGVRSRIHARKTTIMRIDKQQAEDFLNTHHLQQYVSAYYKYALVLNDEIVAVATFSKSRVMQDGAVPYRSYELIRFASKTGTTVTGGLGKLLNHFIEQHHPAHLMTYADRDWSTGEGYVKLGFTETSRTPPQLFWVDIETYERSAITPPLLIHKKYVEVMNAGNIKFVMDRRTTF
ncbi:MAG: hypothetical protein V4590_04860 [Bacteroidota bacterium]